MQTSNKRTKAFLGALIGAGVSLIGGAASSIIGANSAKRQQVLAQIDQNRRDTYEAAQNLGAGYGDQSYLKGLNQHVVFKCGGRKRRKAEGGGNFDYSSVINGASSAIDNIGSALTNASIAKHSSVNSQSFMANVPKVDIVQPDYITTTDYQDRLASILRCGGRKAR